MKLPKLLLSQPHCHFSTAIAVFKQLQIEKCMYKDQFGMILLIYNMIHLTKNKVTNSQQRIHQFTVTSAKQFLPIHPLIYVINVRISKPTFKEHLFFVLSKGD